MLIVVNFCVGSFCRIAMVLNTDVAICISWRNSSLNEPVTTSQTAVKTSQFCGLFCYFFTGYTYITDF